MKWTETSPGVWLSDCGLGRISRYTSVPPYFAMWRREEPGKGRWLRLTAGGRYTYRRSLEAARETVERAVEDADRKEAA